MTRTPPVSRTLFLAALVALGAVASAQEGPQKLPAIRLAIGMHAIQAEVAKTPREHGIGLMFRPSMPASDGMLFIFEQRGPQCFWMKNTLLPLSAAFIADDGAITNIEAMKPQTLDAHCSAKDVRYVLEMNEGWFAKRGIKPGMKVQGGPFTR
jgi:uncharacterized protein